MTQVRRLAGPGAMAAAMLAVLIGLGVWQLHRLTWKRGLLAAIDHAEASAPVSLPASPKPFQKVAVTGTLRTELSALYGVEVRDTPTGPLMGGQLIQPLIRSDGPPVLIDRGWVPEASGFAPSTGTVRLNAYVRMPDRPHWFSPKNDPVRRRFYTLDPTAIGGALGLAPVAPFTLVALGDASAPGQPIPATALPRPPNDHLSYAITWFGLALILGAMFGLWALRAIREPQGRT